MEYQSKPRHMWRINSNEFADVKKGDQKVIWYVDFLE